MPAGRRSVEDALATANDAQSSNVQRLPAVHTAHNVLGHVAGGMNEFIGYQQHALAPCIRRTRRDDGV